MLDEGFAVDTADVAATGRSACDLAEDLRSARSTWDGATRDGGPSCGMDIVERAYQQMQDAWFDEVGVHITILEQLCETLGGTARNYDEMDQETADGFRGGDARV